MRRLLPGDGSNVGSSWSSQFASGKGGFRAFDGFTLGSTASINQSSWWGIYFNTSLANETPNTTQWNIGFFADNGGAAGAQLSASTLTSGQVSTTLVGPGFFGNNTGSHCCLKLRASIRFSHGLLAPAGALLGLGSLVLLWRKRRQ